MDQEPILDPKGWDFFEQKLDGTFQSEKGRQSSSIPVDDYHFDTIIRQRLQRAKATNSDVLGHWQLMSHKLDEEWIRTQKILAYKILELTLVFLLFLGFFHFYTPTLKTPALPANGIVAGQHHPESSDQPKLLHPSLEIPTAPPLPPSKAINPHSSSIPLLMPMDNPKMISQTTSTELLEIPLTNKPFLAGIDEIERLSPSRYIQSSRKLPESIHKMEEKTENITKLDLMAFIDTKMPSLVDSESEFIFELTPKLTIISPKVRVGMYGTADYNYVQEAYYSSRGRRASGYGGGISLGFDYNRWEIETGLQYNAKLYQPDADTRSPLKNIEFNLVSIPLNFRYNILLKDKWRVYGLFGSSLHAAVQANYYKKYSAPQKPGSPAPPPSYRHLPGGLFENGSFKENSFLTANLGLGVESYFTENTSLFIQPTQYLPLQYFNVGLGPKKETFRTLSIFAGIKIKL